MVLSLIHWLLVIFVLGLVLGFNFIPTFVAFARGHPQRAGIFILNLLLGWTGIGWLAALIWSLSGGRPQDGGGRQSLIFAEMPRLSKHP